VRYIGEVENTIVADYNFTEGLCVIESDKEVTHAQKEGLIQAIQELAEAGWCINTGHRFFLLKNFYETNFEKASRGGIFKVRSFDLKQVLTSVPEKIRRLKEEQKIKQGSNHGDLP